MRARLVDCRMDLDDVNRMMNIGLPTDESDTLGRLIYSMLGGVPKVGHEIIVDGVKITVLSLVDCRPKKARVVKGD